MWGNPTLLATPKTWIRTLKKLDLKNLDLEKPGPSKTWILKNKE